MNNIFVVGTSGSGKSTLARAISKKLSIPHIEMDAIIWLPNWQKRDPDEYKEIIEQLMLKNAKVVIDGNFIGDRVEPQPGDTLVFLDLPRLLVFSRILRRSLRRVVFRQKLWSGNREHWKFLLSRNPEINPVLWSWISHERRRQSYLNYSSSRPDLEIYRITNRRELSNFLKTL